MKNFDVAIIGGGLIGVSIAFELAGEKLRAIVFDRQNPGQEASWAAAGMLSPAPDSARDLPLVPLGRESLKMYPEYVASIEETSGQSAALTHKGTLEIFPGPGGEMDRDRRVAECLRLGLAAEPIVISRAQQQDGAIGPAACSAAWLPEERTVEPRSLMSAVLAAARQRNVEIRASCPVTGLCIDGDRCTGVVAGGEEFCAGKVVVAAGCYSGRIAPESDLFYRYAPTRPVRGQIISLRPDRVSLRRVLRSKRGYLVPRRDGSVIAGSTSEEAGFEKRVTPGGLRRVLDAALELFPVLDGAELIGTWAGLRPGTPDDLPILGPTDIEGLLIATGHYRNGILLAPVTARLVREWITGGGTTVDVGAFSPLRFANSKSHASSAQ